MKSPWQLKLVVVPVGIHAFTAAASDDLDAWTLSAPVAVTVNTPPVAGCRNVTVPAGSDGTARASVSFGSYDVDFQDEFSLTQSPPSPSPIGCTLVTLTATDTYGASDFCTATVTVLFPLSIAVAPQVSNGAFHVRFAAPPACSYTIESASNVNGPWATFTNLTVGSIGLFDLFDATMATQRFYRTRLP